MKFQWKVLGPRKEWCILLSLVIGEQWRQKGYNAVWFPLVRHKTLGAQFSWEELWIQWLKTTRNKQFLVNRGFAKTLHIAIVEYWDDWVNNSRRLRFLISQIQNWIDLVELEMHIKSKDIFVTAPMSAHPSRCIYSIHNCRSIICQAPYPEIGDEVCVVGLKKGCAMWNCSNVDIQCFSWYISFAWNILDTCSIQERYMGDFIVRN